MYAFRTPSFLACLLACLTVTFSFSAAQPSPPQTPAPKPSGAQKTATQKKVAATFDSFVSAVAKRDAHRLHQQLHEDLQKNVDEPILQFLLDEIEKLGAMSDDDYDQSIEKKRVDGIQVETTTAALLFPRGPLNVTVAIRQSQIISFDFKADRLDRLDQKLGFRLFGESKFSKSVGDYLAPRGEKMLKLVLAGEDESAYALFHPEIQQQAPLEKVKEIFATARDTHGSLTSIEYQGITVNIEEEGKLKNFTLNYLLDCEKNSAKGTITFQVVGLSAALVGINFLPLTDEAPLPEKTAKKSETKIYRHDKEKLSASHADKFVPFRFNYPTGWELDSVAGTEDSPNSVKVKRNIDLSDELTFTQENFAVGSCQVSGVGELATLQLQVLTEQLRDQFEKGFPKFSLNREGKMKFGKYDGYGFDFSCKLPHEKKGEVDCWGRLVLLTPSVIGQSHGLAIVMLATSEAPELKSLDDLGVKGELPIIIESFQVGSPVPALPIRTLPVPAPPKVYDDVPAPPAP